MSDRVAKERARKRRNRAREYQRWVNSGRCGSCGDVRSLLSSCACDKCRNRNNDKKREKYALLKSKGICIVCRTADAWNGQVLCLSCAKKRRVSKDERQPS